MEVVPTDELLAAKSVIVLAVFALVFCLERARPKALPPLFLAGGGRAAQRRVLRNLGLFACNLPLSAFFVLPFTLWVTTHALWVRPDRLGKSPGLAADILLLDFWIYF